MLLESIKLENFRQFRKRFTETLLSLHRAQHNAVIEILLYERIQQHDGERRDHNGGVLNQLCQLSCLYGSRADLRHTHHLVVNQDVA